MATAISCGFAPFAALSGGVWIFGNARAARRIPSARSAQLNEINNLPPFQRPTDVSARKCYRL
jgi:hypothetical protein